MKFFNDPNVLAFISDAQVNFIPESFDDPLTAQQQQYLKAHTGLDILQVFWRKQVHGDTIIRAKGSPADCRHAPDADAFVTTQKGLPIAIRTADCVPAFIYDPALNAAGLVHAGWQGTYKEITAKTIIMMVQQLGCSAKNLRVALGPAIRSCCFQVGQEFRQYFPKETFERDGRLYTDVIAANRRQALEQGVLPDNIFDSGVCTMCDTKNYFSFRRDADKSGRMVSVMMLT